MSSGKFRGWHHAYGGIILIVIGCAFRWWEFVIFGGYILADDLVYHLFGEDTPGRKVNRWLYKNFQWYADVLKFLDKLFGRRYD